MGSRMFRCGFGDGGWACMIFEMGFGRFCGCFGLSWAMVWSALEHMGMRGHRMNKRVEGIQGSSLQRV
jgi:hypothetical protein